MTNFIRHPTKEELEAELDRIRESPGDDGVLQLIVRRPRVGEREVLAAGELDLTDGLVGDTWKHRSSSRTRNGRAHPDMQLNIMNARVIGLIAGEQEHWPLAGDQLFVDLDLSLVNLPPWTRLAIGSAIVQVTDQPHTGCGKFTSRFGIDAATFVNSPLGRELCLRGINARVIQPGTVRVGDRVRKLIEP
jgi:MOSC domain